MRTDKSAMDALDPDASPGRLGKRVGVRRVNNVPVFIMGAVVLAFLLVMMMVATDRAAQQAAPPVTQAVPARSTTSFAEAIAGSHESGVIEPASPLVLPAPVMEPAADETKEDVGTITAMDLYPPATYIANLTPPVDDDEALRIRLAKLQLLEQAVKAPTGVPVSMPPSVASAQRPSLGNRAPTTREEMIAEMQRVRREAADARESDPTAAYNARLAQIGGFNAGGLGGIAALSGLMVDESAEDIDSPTGYAQFDGDGSDRWQLNSTVQAPRTPYELRAGYVIPAILISGINSELPGQIMGQVSQDVYDTATGNHLLIPQGSRLVGSYSSSVGYGQARVLVAWQRIVFPDGKAIDIGSMPGADTAGFSAFADKVDSHYFRTFSSAFLMSGITAGVAYSQDKDQATNSNGMYSPSMSSEMSRALGQQLGQVTAQLIAKNLNIAPTLEIRPGYRFNVVATKDLTFSAPYKAFDYQRQK